MHGTHSLPLATFVIGIAFGFLASLFLLRTPAPITPAPIATATSSYSSAANHFSLAYPSDLAVSEYADSDAGPTIVFQQPDGHVGFQVFVLPEKGALSTAEILHEHPGLKAAAIEEVIVATSTRAFGFTENIAGIGDLREVWFSYGSRRYEVVTFPYLADWLTPILASMRFDPR